MKYNKNPRRRMRPDHIEVFHPEQASTLLPYLLQVLQPRSRTEIKSLMLHSHVLLNGEPTTQFDDPVAPGDILEVNFSRPYLKLTHPMLHLLYEDDDLVVVEKASGLLTVPAGKVREKTAQTIVDDYLYNKDGRTHAYVVHRLDQFTSGILIFAKSAKIQRRLREAWSTYVVDRRYMAVVEGCPAQEEGEIATYLKENKVMKVYSVNDPQQGKLAVTRYRVVGVNYHYAQLDVQILTGRKNQIRVHLSEMGHPVAGDRKYGARTNPKGRLMLHNYLLHLVHPVTRQKLCFEMELPKGFVIR